METTTHMKKSEQIVALQQQNLQLIQELEELKNKHKSAEDSSNSWYKNYGEVKKNIDQIHEFLDGLPDAPEKLNKDGYTEKSVLLRLSIYLANRK